MTPQGAGIPWIATAWAAGAICGLPAQCFGATTGAQQPADPRQQMVAVLSAPGPHPSLGDQARTWDRFVGTWDCDFGFYLEDGSVRHSPGELEFGWVLDGRAMQDLWITYPGKGETERRIGTSIRFFDDKSRTWRVVFVSPQFGAVLTVQGGVERDRIVLSGRDADGSQLRWSFNDIQDDSFTWRGEKSRDGGKTWKLEEEHHMQRRPSGRVGHVPRAHAAARSSSSSRSRVLRVSDAARSSSARASSKRPSLARKSARTLGRRW
jgi:hypothetical protein